MDLAAAEAANEYRFDDIPVTLRRKPPAKVWTARIKLHSGSKTERIEISTKERDLAKAIAAANRIYAEYRFRVEVKNESLRGISFRQAADEFMANMEAKVASGQEKPWKLERLRVGLYRYYVRYFGDRRIDQIKDEDLEAHTAWRLTLHEQEPESTLTYYRLGKTVSRRHKERRPRVSSLRKERHYFGWVMQWAAKRSWLSGPIPSYDRLRGRGRRREFKDMEMRQILQISAERIRERASCPTRKPGKTLRDDPVLRQRLLLHYRILLLYLAGVRPQEVRQLRFRQFRAGRNLAGGTDYVIDVDGVKADKHKRAVVCLPGVKELIDQLRATYRVFDGREPRPSDYLFHNRDGKFIGKANKSMKALLVAAGVVAEDEEEAEARRERDRERKRTGARAPYKTQERETINDSDEDGEDDDYGLSFYCIRHTFATERLYEGINVSRLARLMGTSPLMIYLHYDHVISEIENSGVHRAPWTTEPYLVRLRDLGLGVEDEDEVEAAMLWWHESPELAAIRRAVSAGASGPMVLAASRPLAVRQEAGVWYAGLGDVDGNMEWVAQPADVVAAVTKLWRAVREGEGNAIRLAAAELKHCHDKAGRRAADAERAVEIARAWREGMKGDVALDIFARAMWE